MDDDSTDDEAARERLAESLVDEALLGYDDLVEPDTLAEIRSYLVDELLCTSYGRARLRRLAAPPTLQASDEVLISDATLAKLKKKSQVS